MHFQHTIYLGSALYSNILSLNESTLQGKVGVCLCVGSVSGKSVGGIVYPQHAAKIPVPLPDLSSLGKCCVVN